MAPRTTTHPPAPPPPALLPVVDFGSSLNLAHLAQSAQLPPLPTAPTTTTTRTRQLAASTSAPAPPPPPVVPRNPDLQHVARTVLKAKRIAVVCGAGISTATGIPDFRSGAGLFESLKKQYPDARLSSGKDLFDVGLFQSEQTASIFYNMIAALHKQADGVAPTAFHSWLKQLDDDGKLFRVYTQNIDALEEKAGLTYGLGDKTLPLPPRRRAAAPRSPSKPSTTATSAHASGSTTPLPAALSAPALGPTSSQMSLASSTASTASTSYPTPRSSQSPPPTHSTIPRCIPLHGHLSTLSCSLCKLVTPTASYLDLLSSGTAPLCPACLAKEALRSAAGERARGVGVLRPDVVLYGEEHKDGERVGEITQRDLMGQRPDLLIVVGTTLKVKGTKRLVRELAKVIKPVSSSSSTASSSSAASTSSSTATSAPSSTSAKPAPVHTIYLNAEFPSPAREWADVFDVWCRGDIQEFVAALAREAGRIETEARERDERRRVRVEKAGARKRAAEEAAGAAGAGVGAGVGAAAGAKVGAAPSPLSPVKSARPPPLDRSHLPTVRSPTKAAAAAAVGGLPLVLPRSAALPLLPLENAPEPSRARVRARAATPPASPSSASAAAAAHLAGSHAPVSNGAPLAKRPRTRASPPAPSSTAPAPAVPSSSAPTGSSAPRPQPFALELSPPRPGSASGSSSRMSRTRSSSSSTAQAQAQVGAVPYSLPALPQLTSATSGANKPAPRASLVRSTPLVDGAGRPILVRSASSSSLSSVASSQGLGIGEGDGEAERADSTMTAHDNVVVVADSADEDASGSCAAAPASSKRKRGRSTVKRSGTSTSAATSASTSTASTTSSRKTKGTASPGPAVSRRTTRSSPHGVGVRARRSSRASTASATLSSLDAAAAATRRTSPGAAVKPFAVAAKGRAKGAKAHEQVQAQPQTRLAFEVTKKRVGDVTGTKRR